MSTGSVCGQGVQYHTLPAVGARGVLAEQVFPSSQLEEFSLAGHAGGEYICDRGHVLRNLHGVPVPGAVPTFRVRASMDPAGAAHLARADLCIEPHPEEKGDPSASLGSMTC